MLLAAKRDGAMLDPCAHCRRQTSQRSMCPGIERAYQADAVSGQRCGHRCRHERASLCGVGGWAVRWAACGGALPACAGSCVTAVNAVSARATSASEPPGRATVRQPRSPVTRRCGATCTSGQPSRSALPSISARLSRLSAVSGNAVGYRAGPCASRSALPDSMPDAVGASVLVGLEACVVLTCAANPPYPTVAPLGPMLSAVTRVG